MVGEMESITTHETSTNETNTDNVTDLAKNAQLYKSIGIGTAVAIFLAMMLYLIICFACCNGAEKVASAHRSRMAKTTTKTAAKKAGGKSSKKSKKTQAKGKTTVLKSAKIKSNK